MHTGRTTVNNPNQGNWKPDHRAVYVSWSVSLAQTDISRQANEETESEYMNHDL